MSNVAILPGWGERDPDAILEAAKNAGLIDVVVVGFTADGSSFISTSFSDCQSVLWELAVAQNALISNASVE